MTHREGFSNLQFLIGSIVIELIVLIPPVDAEIGLECIDWFGLHSSTRQIVPIVHYSVWETVLAKSCARKVLLQFQRMTSVTVYPCIDIVQPYSLPHPTHGDMKEWNSNDNVSKLQQNGAQFNFFLSLCTKPESVSQLLCAALLNLLIEDSTLGVLWKLYPRFMEGT